MLIMMGKKIIRILHSKSLLNWTYENLSFTVQCPNPPDLTNGMITTPGGHGVGNIAYYMCNPCLSIVGPKKRTCLADGTWSGPDPVCQCKYGKVS